MLSRDALQLVARQAVGGMRDALTMIDQITSYSGLSATDEEVSRILGLVDTKVRFQLLKALLAKDPTTAMAKFHEMQQRGHNFQDILSDLLQSVKNLSLIHMFTRQKGQLPPTLFQEIPEEDLKHYKSLVPAVSLDELQQMFSCFNGTGRAGQTEQSCANLFRNGHNPTDERASIGGNSGIIATGKGIA